MFKISSTHAWFSVTLSLWENSISLGDTMSLSDGLIGDSQGLCQSGNGRHRKKSPRNLSLHGLLIKGVAGTAQDVANLVANQFFHRFTRRSQIFSRIKFLRVFEKNLADRARSS